MMKPDKTNTRRQFLIATSATAASAMLGGCASGGRNSAVPIAVEALGEKTKREIGEKYLHSHSLQQRMMHLGAKEGKRILFKSGTDDAFIPDIVPDRLSDAVRDAKKRGYLSLHRHHMKGAIRYDIDNRSVSVYKRLSKKHIRTSTLMELNHIDGDFIVRSDRKTQKIVASLGVNKYDFYPVSFIFDRVYAQGKRFNTDVFFNYGGKAKVIFFTTTPSYIYLTPYKRQLFINFLDARGILYKTNRSSGVAISDNFTNWSIAMDKLERIQKYRHAVYGIYDGRNYFEIADSNYRDSEITIELIDWTPNGEREYNFYYKGKHRKVITNKRFLHFYSTNGRDKFLIKFY